MRALPLLLALLTIGLQAQPARSQRAVEMLREAQQESERSHTPIPRATYERVIAAAVDERDRWTEVTARRGLAVALRTSGDHKEARAQLETALGMCEQLRDGACMGWTLSELGWIAFSDARADEADRLWRRAIAAFDSAGYQRGRAEMLHNRLFTVSPGPEKRALLREGLELSRRLGDVRIESQFLYKLGEQQMWDGDFAAAIVTLERAVAGFERTGHPAFAARTLIPLGRLHWVHGRADRALAIQQRAYDTFKKIDDRDGMVLALAAIASGHQGLGQLKEALAFQQRALAAAIERGGQRNINLQRLQLARLYVQLREPQRARVLVDEVIAGSDAFARRLASAVAADVWFALGELDKALTTVTEAIATTFEPTTHPALLALRARIEDRLDRPQQALADVAAAIGEIERLRPRLVQTDPMKVGFGERLQWIFDFAIDLRARRGDPRGALEAAEQARARAFVDLLATRQVPALAADPELSTLRQIDADLREGAEAAPDAGRSEAMDKLRARWRTADPDLRSLIAAEPFSLTQLSTAAARLDSTILDYWVGDERTIVWVVGRDGLVTHAVIPAGSARIAKLVRATADAPAHAFVTGTPLVRTAAPKTAWRQLYDLLIAPIAASLPRASGSLLTIVPHGPLSRLPFAALLDANGRYLIERYALHYVPAGAVLEQTAKKAAQLPASRGRFLLVSQPNTTATGPDGQHLPPLPEAAREARAIARLLQPGAATTLSGAAAREDRVRAEMPATDAIHFATHAILRDDQSLESFLALADGRFTAQEIYSLKLQAALVVLSACRTAAGRITGDGIVGLTRAFFYAGTPSVIATLWNLADVSGSRIMPGFYPRWIAGTDKARALRDAQLAFIAQLRSGKVSMDSAAGPVRLEEDPFLWAGYVLLGEPR
jgi:CHAT domain-containing protein/tetratricopeptide (TPR) repeat protein